VARAVSGSAATAGAAITLAGMSSETRAISPVSAMARKTRSSVRRSAKTGYGVRVTAAAKYPPQAPEPGEFDSPKAIRAGLLPEERGDFDQAYKRALQEAGETLSLEGLHVMLAHWTLIARQTQADPAGHRQMLQQAAQTLRTGEPPAGAVEWADLKQELGLQ
jgi:hypothetical protein